MKRVMVSVILIVGLFFCLGFRESPAPQMTSLPEKVCRVKWVYDGDSFECRDGTEVRLAAVDAPEHGMYGAEAAKQWLRRRIRGKVVVLRVVDRDRYRRFIAFVFVGVNVKEARRLEQTLNRALVESGRGWVYAHPSVQEYLPNLIESQRQAMAAGLGIWPAVARLKRHVVGNRRSLRFHEPTCSSVRKMSHRNRVVLTLWEAFRRGMAPARDCQPLRGFTE